jgi:dTDP-4-amino-4,6-dideoxygalactose transaminase
VNVPFLDVGAGVRELRRPIDQAIDEVLRGGRYILGPAVATFESAFADRVGVRHCIGVSSGFDALHLALRAMGVGPGDEVVVPGFTYVATWSAVHHVGATPVPIEPDARTYNLDPTRLDLAISDRTRAIVPVHLYGQPADMSTIDEIARARGVPVLEDAAQAHGAHPVGRRTAAWSFYPTKNLGGLGDGGAVTTDDDAIAASLRSLRNQGHPQGFTARLDELQAAVLSVKLTHLDEWNERRRRNAMRYLDGLSDTELVLPFVPTWATPVWHQFVVRAIDRDGLRSRLAAEGIETATHYPVPPHRQLGAAVDLPITDQLSAEVLSLPIGPHTTSEQLDRVIEALCRA